MKLNGVTQFSAFRRIPQQRNQRREAFDSFPFFDGLQNYVQVDDVVRGPDPNCPPDYVISMEGRRISAELTRLNPKVFGDRGNSRIAAFKRWKDEVKTDPSPERRFQWGVFTLGESVSAFRAQVERKASGARAYAKDYDENWLVLQAESGSPAAGLVERKFGAERGHDESVLNFAGKHLFEMHRTCRSAAPFDYVILFCGPHLLGFASGEKLHSLLEPDAELLARGAQVSSECLERRLELFSASRRSGDAVFWVDFIALE